MFKHLKKLLVLTSVVRGYNILIIVLAQYLASIYILSPKELGIWDVITNTQLFLIIFSISFIIAAGYIINDFYDKEKDIINKPSKTILDSKISKTFKLSSYFFYNISGALIALFVSWRVFLFVAFYAFIIWFYSHKIKKITVWGNIYASVLAVFPFFGIFLFYHNYSLIIFLHAVFLFLLVLIRELSKDMLTYRGDLIYNYQTIPVRYGLIRSKIAISIVSLLILIPGSLIIYFGKIGAMQVYFYITFGVLTIIMHGMWSINGVKWYNLQYNVVKFLIVLGVFSIALIPYKLVI